MGLCEVSASIVTHNNMKTIDSTISSLLKYTAGVDFKLFIIDNLSTDGTVQYIKEHFPMVIITEPGKNIGFGAGHNLVLPMITSKYHAVVNPDVIIRDDAISEMTEYMEKNEDVGLLSPRICFPDGRDQILGKRNPKPKYLIASRLRKGKEISKSLREYAMLDCDLSKPTEIENASGCFMFFRTEILRKIGGFDERYFMYFEDADITRMVNRVSKTVYYPYARIYHVWGRESKRNTKLMMIHIKSMFSYFFKWFGK